MAERIERVKARMEKCLKTHESCIGQTVSGGCLPRRVIDISKFSESKQLFLRETSSLKGDYACLSYCWGKENDFVTTKNNINAMMEGFSWDDMPLIYKDAVWVASEIGLSYLWIDALCIIQRKDKNDDLKDWEEQSALMGQIYGNATLTIAVANCSSTHESFLEQCPIYPSTIAIPDPRDPNKASAQIYARRKCDHSGFKAGNEFRNRFLPSSPNALRHRAWCFQEYFLSTRILSFGHDEMVFECNNGACCECEEYPGNNTRGMKSRYADYLASITHSGSINTLWLELVREFANRQLTVLEDKLPALSGVANLFQQRSGLRYLSGHWDDSEFICSLTWKNEGSHRCKPPPINYRAPSWSWASVDSEISLGSSSLTSIGELKWDKILIWPENCIITKNIWPATVDLTGSVHGGHIVVRGFLLEANLMWDSSYDSGSRPCISRNHSEGNWIELDRAISADDREVACWYLGKMEDKAAHGLMVLEKKVNRTYQRIGWCTIFEDPYKWDQRHSTFVEGYGDCLRVFAII